MTIAQRLAELSLGDEEHDVLAAELESLAHAPLDHAGAVSVLRWHALSGYSLALTQFTGGRVTIDGGTGALLEAIGSAAPFARELEAPVAAVRQRGDRVEVTTRDGAVRFARVGRGCRAAQRARGDHVRSAAAARQAGGDRRPVSPAGGSS